MVKVCRTKSKALARYESRQKRSRLGRFWVPKLAKVEPWIPGGHGRSVIPNGVIGQHLYKRNPKGKTKKYFFDITKKIKLNFLHDEKRFFDEIFLKLF